MNLTYYKIGSFLSIFLLFGCQQQTKSPETTILAKITPLCASVSNSIDLDKLPPPLFKEGQGNSHFVVTTKSAEAQRWCDQGINLLHGFWHLEAYRAFREAMRADSTCAMAYWGMAMCQPGFGVAQQKTWNDAIAKALALKNNSSPVEQAFIDAADILIHKGIGAAQDAFRNLYKNFPNEPEALAFAAIILRQHEDEKTQEEVKTLLEDALKRFPNHVGLRHYYVHIMELRPDFAKANEIAAKMAVLAPNSPHIVHMPGHLYFLAGNYNKTISVFEQARKLEQAYHKTENIPYVVNQNYMHNLHYLAVAYSEIGDKTKALEAAESYSNITLSNTQVVDGPELALLYEGRILPALVHIRFRDYKAAEEKILFWLNSIDYPLTNPFVRNYLKAMQLYCNGMAAVEAGDIQKATQKGSEFAQTIKTFEAEAAQKQNTPEYGSINRTYDIMSMALYELAGWIDNADPKKPFIKEAWDKAIDLQNAIKYAEPPRLMYPIDESLAILHQFRGEKQAAKMAFEKALLKRPKSPRILKLM